MVGRGVGLPDWLQERLCLWLGEWVAVNDPEGEVADEERVNVTDGVADCSPDTLSDRLGEALRDWLRLQVSVDAVREWGLFVRETVCVSVPPADPAPVGVWLPDGDRDLVGRLIDCVLVLPVWVGIGGLTLGLRLVLVVCVRLLLHVAVPLPLRVAVGEYERRDRLKEEVGTSVGV